MIHRTRKLALILLSLAAFVSAAAHSATISVVDRGWYRDDGSHTADSQNAFFGRWGGSDYRAYMVFDVSTLSSPASSITMNLELEGYFSGNASEDFSIYDVSSDPSTFSSGYGSGSAAGGAIFSDLGTGNNYADVTVLSSDAGSLLSIALTSQATSDLEAARTGSGLFALGFMVTSAAGNQGLRWGTNADWDAGSTVTAELVTTPEPATALLIGMSLVALAMMSSPQPRRAGL